MFNRLFISNRRIPAPFKKMIAGLLLAFAGAGVITACAQQPAPDNKSSAAAESSHAVVSRVDTSQRLSTDLSSAIEQVANKAIPAVVHIEVTEHQEMPNPYYAYRDNPFFRRFFGLPKNMPKKLQREMVGIGTGVIIDAEGHILTNYHVVGGATKIVVTLSDGTQYPATVVGVDPETDLGVIKINADKPLPFLTFANSDKATVGQWVVAIGQSRGLDQTVTQGIISAKHRTGITDPGSYQDFLQTDAAINPGNSGGPLLTLDARVIGINSEIASQSGGFEGIGFAIPSNMATHVAKALIAYGKVERGWVGVGAQDLTPNLAKSFGLALPKGALLAEIDKDGPADKAGLKKGDVVVSYQGRPVADASIFRNDVANSPIGQPAQVGIWRDGKKQEISVTVGNLEDERKAVAAVVKERLGVVVRPLTVKEAEDYGLSLPKGVAVKWVDPKGAIGQAGFEVGDVILALDNQPVQGVASFDEMMMAIPHHQKAVLLAISHKTGQSGYVQIEVS
jgi:Do/DeqQ family serine protease